MWVRTRRRVRTQGAPLFARAGRQSAFRAVCARSALGDSCGESSNNRACQPQADHAALPLCESHGPGVEAWAGEMGEGDQNPLSAM